MKKPCTSKIILYLNFSDERGCYIIHFPTTKGDIKKDFCFSLSSFPLWWQIVGVRRGRCWKGTNDTVSVMEEVANIGAHCHPELRSEERGREETLNMGERVNEQCCVTLGDGFIWCDVWHCHECHAARDNLWHSAHKTLSLGRRTNLS